MWIVEGMRYRQTNRQTDTASYRGALSHLKRKEEKTRRNENKTKLSDTETKQNCLMPKQIHSFP